MFAKFLPRLAAFSLALLMQLPAHAEDAAPVTPSAATTRATIAQAIEAEKSHRTKAIVGMAVGGAVMITGAVFSSVTASLNDDDKRNGQPGDRNESTGILVGAALGLPILGISLYNFFDAQSNLRQLRQQSTTLSFTREHGAPGLRLAMTF